MHADERRRFGEAMMLHLDAAYNLARWLTRNDHAAEDVVQDAYCRALKYFRGFRGGESRPWLLRIVRRAAYDWLAKAKFTAKTTQFQDERHGWSVAGNPEEQLLRQSDAQAIRAAINQLPEAFREVTVLRDLEGLSYQQIAEVIDAPIGTVMSRLHRARSQLQQKLLTMAHRED